jgi:hypothetical protein
VNELIEEIETLKAIIAGLQQQLLRIGNQEGVLKAAYLEGQMAKKQPALIAAHEREACRLIVLDNSDAEGICCTDDVLEAFRQRGEK